MLRGLAIAWLAVPLAFSSQAQVPAKDGDIVASAACEHHPKPYEQDQADFRKHLQSEIDEAKKRGIPTRSLDTWQPSETKEEYETAYAHPTACRHVTYLSDGLKVKAFIWEPNDIPQGKKLPVMLALHGGNRDQAKWSADTGYGMKRFVDAGFIVVGVQYRGVDGGEGMEQFGGADVHDVVNAIVMARHLPEADTRNVFMWGASRGGMMVFLAVRDGAKVNAAATMSGMMDMELTAKLHPDWEANNFRALIPNYDANRAKAWEQRSALKVAREVDLPPMLILQGTGDWRVIARESLEAAQIFEERGRPYELHVFEGDLHGMPFNARERDKLVVEWFRRHMVK